MAKVNVSGRVWKSENKKPAQRLTTWEKRQKDRLELETTKAKEKALKDDKAAKKQESVDRLKQRREAKEERERYEKMAAVMHQKRVDRLRRREKRNKLLKER